MKSWIWMIGGICAATVGWLVLGAKRVEPVQQLALQLEHAWGDHHTQV